MDKEIPFWVDEDGQQRCWRNTQNDVIIGILYNDETGEWEVTGENSRLYTAETIEEARRLAKEYMLNTPRPSGMV